MVVDAAANSPALTDGARSMQQAEHRAMRRTAELSRTQAKELAQDAQAVRDLHASRTFAAESSRYTELRSQAQSMRIDSSSFEQALDRAIAN